MARWRPIKTAPRDQTPIIVAAPCKQSESGWLIGEARYLDGGSDEGWWWANETPGDYPAAKIGERWGSVPTLWQPMPAPPSPALSGRAG